MDMKNTLFILSASRRCKRILYIFPEKIQSADLAKLIIYMHVLSKEITLSSDLVIKRDCNDHFEL